jgi:uncharacterized membrane protein
MAYTVLSGLFVLVALLFIVMAGRMLFKRSWFLGWLRGMFGIVVILVAVMLVMSALDLYSYKQLTREQSIANVSFTRIAQQQFEVSLVDGEGRENVYELSGDLWQLDARILKWNNTAAAAGLTTGYRLDRLSGRYISLEKEKTAPRTVYELGTSQSSLDLWGWLQKIGGLSGLIDASYGGSTYLPMADGALFSVGISNAGLVARPLNDRAKSAVADWQ